MNLYYVKADSDEGDALSWMVWANSVQEARRLYGQYMVDYGWQEDLDEAINNIDWVRVIPLTEPAQPRVVDWGESAMYRGRNDSIEHDDYGDPPATDSRPPDLGHATRTEDLPELRQDLAGRTPADRA